MKKFFLSTALLLLFTTGAFAQTARVQIIHNSADAAAATVDIWLTANGSSSILYDDVSFRTATPFFDAPAGIALQVGVAPGTSTAVTDTIANFNLTLTNNETYVVVANGIVSGSGYSPAPAFGLDIFAGGRESSNMMGNTDILVCHGSTDAPMVDVVEVGQGGGRVVDDASYQDFAGYLELATLDYSLQVRTAQGDVTVAQFGAPLQTLGLANAALTVVASGFLDPSMNSNGPAFGLYAAAPTGGPLVQLPSETISTARVQVIHNSADAAAATVDVWLNDGLLIDDFSFRNASPFIDAPAGAPFDISIQPSTSTDTIGALARFTYNLTGGEKYVLVANGIVSPTGYNPAPAFGLDVFAGAREAAAAMGNTDILIAHGSTDAPTVDVVEVAQGAGRIVDDASYQDFAGYLEVLTLDYSLQIRTGSGDNIVAEYAGPLQTLGLNDAALVVVASGFLDPSMNSMGEAFGLWAALPAGGPMVQLPSVPISTARVQVLHNAADAAASTVDVWLNDGLLLDDFDFRTASPFVDAPAGTPFDVSIQPSNSTDTINALAKFTYNLAGGEKYILVANGIVSASGYSPVKPFNLDVYTGALEAATTAGNTSVLVYHGSTDAPTVNVDETSVPAGTIVSNIQYSQFQGYLDLGTLDYELSVVDSASGATVVSYSAPLNTLGLQDVALTVLASGFLDPSNNSSGPAFGLWVATAAGGPMVELPVITAIEDGLDKVLYTIFPNPTSDMLNVQFNSPTGGQLSASLYDIQGREMIRANWGKVAGGNQSRNMDVSQLPSGTYVLRIQRGERLAIQQVQIAH